VAPARASWWSFKSRPQELYWNLYSVLNITSCVLDYYCVVYILAESEFCVSLKKNGAVQGRIKVKGLAS